MTDYEKMRLKNLQDNADFFAKLGINEVGTTCNFEQLSCMKLHHFIGLKSLE